MEACPDPNAAAGPRAYKSTHVALGRRRAPSGSLGQAPRGVHTEHGGRVAVQWGAWHRCDGAMWQWLLGTQ